MLNNAKRPVFLIGGGVNISRANKEMLNLVEITGAPVITTIMGKGVIPTTHDLYVGNIGIHGSYAANKAISKCDVLFSIGTRFNDRITGKTEEVASDAALIHVDIDAAVISRNIAVDVPIVADAKIGNPELDVVVISGDGGMQMNIQEMATAIVYELPITICILNNGYLGNVRQWQEMFFDKRYSSTCMRYRKSCNVKCNTPTVIEFIIDREDNIMPIVPPGNALDEMILEREDN